MVSTKLQQNARNTDILVMGDSYNQEEAMYWQHIREMNILSLE